MQHDGATPDAIAFFRLTHWFMRGLQDTGVVQLGSIFDPWRANQNDQWALLGGIPAVVYPEAAAPAEAVTFDPTYQAIQAEHPRVAFWAHGPQVEALDPAPEGGPRFVFAYRLVDGGCGACPTVGWARVAFDCASDGTYQQARLLSVVPQPAP